MFGQNLKHTKRSSLHPFAIVSEESSQSEETLGADNLMDVDYCEGFKQSYENLCGKASRLNKCNEQEVLPCMAVSPIPRCAENSIIRDSQNNQSIEPDSEDTSNHKGFRSGSKLLGKLKSIRGKFRFAASVAIVSLILNLILMGLIVVAVDSECINGQSHSVDYLFRNFKEFFAYESFLAYLNTLPETDLS